MSLNYRDDLQADILPSYTDSLMHHGIKGQKWGVRRPRNEAGILQGAGAKLAAKQKSHQRMASAFNSTANFAKKTADSIQRDADAHGAKAKATRNIFKKAGHRVAQAWDANAANTWRDSEKHYRKKAAKQQLKADRIKAKRDLQDWGEKANRGYAKNHDDARMARSAEKAIDRFNAANQAAKKRYKQTVNADKIAAYQKKASSYQKAAGRDSAMQKHMSKQRGAMKALTAPVSAIAGANRMINQAKADRARNKAKRLGG